MGAPKLTARRGFLLAAAVAVALPARAAAGRDEVRVGSVAPEGTAWAGPDCVGAGVHAIEHASKRPRVRTILGAALGDEYSQLERVKKGTLEAYAGGMIALSRFVPELGAFALPFLYEDDAEVDAVMASPAGEQARTLVRAAGFELIMLTEVGWRGFGGKRALRAPADFQGLQVRSSEGAQQLEMWKLLGARPRPLPITETIPALETRVVEGFDQTPVFMFAASWHQHAPFFVVSRHVYEPGIYVLSTSAMARIGLRSEAFEGLGPRCTRAVRAEGKAVLTELGRSGTQVLELSTAERRALAERVSAPMRAYFRKHTTPAGRKLLDAIEHALESHRKGR